MKVVKRFNVLYLMSVAYAVLLIMFIVLAWTSGLTAEDA